MNLILLLTVLAISFLVFTILVKIVQTTIKTAILIALVVLAVQFIFGIGPNGFLQMAFQTIQNVFQQNPSGR
ncbi:hypothetical protein [Alkalinema sp. FACHB-956]|uniref:hypothetical protein n=1 Tax=Alkalinema sp. FACHB-956 TaxID=2692768 RepID=UPI001685E2D7|nr:hypothetical protein [Alkalinema sp. FACHB-956]MBD2325281.1 hypothetical protein [Alkalinema sp. FACHB-956]